jgi:pyruvate-ferredoxin/flavodoxin oxidoreductase
MMHPNTFVARTSCAMSNHFYKSILAANEYDDPAVVSVYTTYQPEHGVGDNMAMQQSKLAVDTRTFPVLNYEQLDQSERPPGRFPLLTHVWHNLAWFGCGCH